MTKRKLFTLSPLKIPSKSESKALKDTLDRISPPASPFIERRAPLQTKTEIQLRQACAIVVQGLKPSDGAAVLDDRSLPSKIDYAALKSVQQRRKEEDMKLRSLKQDPARMASLHSHPVKKDSSYPEAPSQPQNLPRRHESLRRAAAKETPAGPVRMETYPGQTHQASITSSKPRSLGDRPKTAPGAEAADSTVSTPMSTSTGYRFDNNSTALTSAGYTPSKGSKRDSPHLAKDQAVIYSPVDAVSGTDWVMDKRGRPSVDQGGSDKRGRPSTDQSIWGRPSIEQGSFRPPSRASSTVRRIKQDLQEYIRPGSSSGSRPPSRDSSNSKDPGFGRQREESTGGWRSWTLSRKASSSSLYNRGANREVKEGKSKEVNLNRDLPPLPGLDQWQEPKPATHVASLMRRASQKSRDTTTTTSDLADDRKSTKSVGVKSEIAVKADTSPQVQFSEEHQIIPAKESDQSVSRKRDDSSPWAMSMADQGVNMGPPEDPFANNSSTTRPKTAKSRTAEDSSAVRSKTSSSNRTDTAHSQQSQGSNFDRKISLDVLRNNPQAHLMSDPPRSFHGKPKSVKSAHREITALPMLPEQTERLTGLRKVFSNFNLGGRKAKKDTGGWPEKFDSSDVKRSFGGPSVESKEKIGISVR